MRDKSKFEFSKVGPQRNLAANFVAGVAPPNVIYLVYQEMRENGSEGANIYLAVVLLSWGGFNLFPPM